MKKKWARCVLTNGSVALIEMPIGVGQVGFLKLCSKAGATEIWFTDRDGDRIRAQHISEVRFMAKAPV